MVFHTYMVNWRRGNLGICAFCCMCITSFSVVVFQTSMVNWRGGTSALSICAFCYMLNIFSVVVFHRSMVNWRRGPWYMCILLYVKLLWCSSIPYIYGQLEERGYMFPRYICIWQYVKHIWCSGVALNIYWSIRGGISALSICAFCYMLNLFSELVFHRSMVNLRRRALVYVTFCYM